MRCIKRMRRRGQERATQALGNGYDRFDGGRWSARVLVRRLKSSGQWVLLGPARAFNLGPKISALVATVSLAVALLSIVKFGAWSFERYVGTMSGIERASGLVKTSGKMIEPHVNSGSASESLIFKETSISSTNRRGGLRQEQKLPATNIGAEAQASFYLHGTPVGDLRRNIVRQQKTYSCPEAAGAGSGLLDYLSMNDGYCDCPGSGFDEPGTSACSGMASLGEPLFFCGERDGRHIFSSRVEDGICDCCDGSDEGLGQHLCTDMCIEWAEEKQRKATTLAKNRLLGLDLLKRTPSLGPIFERGATSSSLTSEQVNALLGKSKLTLNQGEYAYQLTASGMIQGPKGHTGQRFALGKKGPRWSSESKVLYFDEGARCPNGVMRSVSVVLVCPSGSNANIELIDVAEKQTCLYTASLATPLGCL